MYSWGHFGVCQNSCPAIIYNLLVECVCQEHEITALDDGRSKSDVAFAAETFCFNILLNIYPTCLAKH